MVLIVAPSEHSGSRGSSTAPIPTTPSSSDLSRLLEFGEINALADTFEAVPDELTSRLGVRIKRFGSAVAIAMDRFNLPPFNRTVGLGLAEPTTEDLVDGIVDFYGRAGLTFMVQVSPFAKPAEIPLWLEARGIHRVDNWAKVYRGAEPPAEVATDLRVEQIGPEHGEAFTSVAIAAFGLPNEFRDFARVFLAAPNTRHYLAFDVDRPVATGSLLLRGELACLVNGATLATDRRRGAQGALMVRRVRDALALGCRWISTETGEDTADHPNASYRNMVRTGFQLAYLRPNYVFSPSAIG